MRTPYDKSEITAEVIENLLKQRDVRKNEMQEVWSNLFLEFKQIEGSSRDRPDAKVRAMIAVNEDYLGKLRRFQFAQRQVTVMWQVLGRAGIVDEEEDDTEE